MLALLFVPEDITCAPFSATVLTKLFSQVLFSAPFACFSDVSSLTYERKESFPRLGFNVSGLTKVSETVYQTDAIKLTLPTVTQDGTDIIKAGKSKTFTFSVEWDSSVDEATVGTGQTASFDITFTYQQADINGSFTGTQSFN